MSDLIVLKARLGLMNIKARIENTLQEIEEKRPNAESYIRGAKDGIREIVEALHVIQILEQELILSRQRNFDLERYVLEIKSKIEIRKQEKILEEKMKKEGF
jgi:hypothetical protein